MYDFTPIDYPEWVDLYVPKPFDHDGFDWVASRVVIGDVNHLTRTNGRIEHFYRLMAPGGDREDDLLVDAVIGRDGQIGLLNYPFVTEDGARASWVNNGPGTQLSPAGAAYLSRFGTVGLGRHLVSKAHICREDQDLTDAQFEASARLSAAIHQQACCPWDCFPFNPLYGSVLNFWHCDFGFEACPGEAFQRRWSQPLEDRVRALLKEAQTGMVEDFSPPPMGRKPPAGVRYPDGWNADTARELFGEIDHCRADGTRCALTFDPGHVVCCEWLRFGWRTGELPVPLVWIEGEVLDGQRQDLVVFTGGNRLVRRGHGQPWRWERLGDRPGHRREGEVTRALGA